MGFLAVIVDNCGETALRLNAAVFNIALCKMESRTNVCCGSSPPSCSKQKQLQFLQTHLKVENSQSDCWAEFDARKKLYLLLTYA